MKRLNAPSVVLPLVTLTLALVVLAVLVENQQGVEAKGLRGKVGATMVRSSLGGRSRKRHAYGQKNYEGQVSKRNGNEDEGGPGGLYDWDGKLLRKVRRRNKKKVTTTAAPPTEDTPQVTTERGNRPGFKCCSPVRIELDSGFGVGAVSRPK